MVKSSLRRFNDRILPRLRGRRSTIYPNWQPWRVRRGPEVRRPHARPKTTLAVRWYESRRSRAGRWFRHLPVLRLAGPWFALPSALVRALRAGGRFAQELLRGLEADAESGWFPQRRRPWPD